MKVEHIGIAVEDLSEAISTYETLLNTGCYKRETVESQHVDTAFLKADETKVELLGATSPQSVVTAFIEKRGEGVHHIAFEVGDIEQEMKRLQHEGFNLLTDEPQQGADNKRVAFVHPKDNNGVLIELCQSIN